MCGGVSKEKGGATEAGGLDNKVGTVLKGILP